MWHAQWIGVGPALCRWRPAFLGHAPRISGNFHGRRGIAKKPESAGFALAARCAGPGAQFLNGALAEKAIIALPLASYGQHLIRDAELPGFFVIMGKRRKTFMVQRDLRTNGRRQSIGIKLGEVGDLKTREARAKAKELLGSIAKGVDPRPTAQTSERQED